jgi:hypothetical protein
LIVPLSVAVIAGTLILAQAEISPSVVRSRTITDKAMRSSSVLLDRYPTIAGRSLPNAVVAKLRIANVAVYLPATLPKAAPKFASVSAVPGLYRLELTFTAVCNGSHACLYSSLRSAATAAAVVPLDDGHNQQIQYAGQSMTYHPPVCTYYCGPGGLYYTKDGAVHAIEVRGAQLPLLEKLYDSSVKVQ